MVTSNPLRLLAFYSIGFVSFAFLFKHNTFHAHSITHPHFALLFQLLSSSSHFSSLEKPGASEVVKLSSWRHELAVEGHNLSPVVCFANFAILGMFFTFSLSFPCPLLYLLRCCSVIFFFFLLKFIFKDFVEYRNVWLCGVCGLCALSNGLFGWREEGGGVEGSRVELAKNKLILC